MNENIQFLNEQIRSLQNMLIEMRLDQGLMSIDLKYLRKSEDRNFERLENKINNLDKSLIKIKNLIRNIQ
ncbi:hypothetical protein BU049_04885 [Staphylococcus simulans]|nr:hypothetical protein BU049_04885 [Staphylococcus simulans]